MSPLRALAATLLLLASTFALAPAVGGAAVFHEDWEDGLDGWTVQGAGASVACADGDCRLRVDPACCDGANGVSVARATSIPLGQPLTLDVEIENENLWGDTDLNVFLAFDHGHLVLHVTAWFNDGVMLFSDTGSDGYAGDYGSGRVDLRVLVNGTQAQALVLDEHGGVAGASPLVDLNPNATTLERVSIDGVQWNFEETEAVLFGDLSITPGATCFEPMVRLGGWPYGLAPLNATFFPEVVVPSCGPAASWSLDFGDGASVAGEGAPPAEVEHAYERGTYLAVLTVSMADGRERSASLRVVSYDHHLETFAGSVLAGALWVHDQPPERHSFATVAFDAVAYLDVTGLWPATDLDVVFFDEAGAETGSCAYLLYEEHFCWVPQGAASFEVRGNLAVAVSWTLTYENYVY